MRTRTDRAELAERQKKRLRTREGKILLDVERAGWGDDSVTGGNLIRAFAPTGGTSSSRKMQIEFQIQGECSKQEDIATSVRRAVASGELLPGARLPTRAELESTLDVGRSTIQKALDQLARDGYTRARGKLGTFITEYPPCQHRYGIVFNDGPQESHWSGYHEALRQVGHEFGHTPECEVVCYYGVYEENRGDYEKLLTDIQSERLAGVLFANQPWPIEKSAIIQQERVPCMAVFSPAAGRTMPHVTTVDFDADSLFEAAISVLVDRGCQRPAVLIGGGYDLQVLHLRRALASHDLSYDPVMLQGVSLGEVELAEHVVELWMRLPESARPEGLFVADDNLVEWACSGVRRGGVQPGIDMPVVVHCNFPTRSGGPMPLERVGFDIHALVQHFIDTTNARRRGKPFQQHTKLVAVHERELDKPPQPLSENF